MTRRSTPFAAAILAVTFIFGGPAAAQTVSPEAIAAARELVVVMRAAEQFKTILPLIMRQLKPAIAQGRPEVERDFDAMIPVLNEIMSAQNEQIAKLVDDIAMIYARNFTVDEMRRVTAFYQEPVGQKFLDKMPVITQESMAAGQVFGPPSRSSCRSGWSRSCANAATRSDRGLGRADVSAACTRVKPLQ